MVIFERQRFPLGGRFLLAAVVLGGFAYAQAGQLELELDFGRLMHKETKKAEYKKITYGSTKSSAPAVILQILLKRQNLFMLSSMRL